jgi:glycosyltransferase involved in cell wall biosynthesis
MSQEKRVLEFVEAFARAGIDAEARLFGAGSLLRQVQERISARGLDGRVTVVGPVAHADALAAMRDADALVQTSVGFETQGLTPFEAAALGTPTVYCDPAIAADVAATPGWLAEDDSVDALAVVLRQAVGELAAHLPGGAGLRVSEQQTRGFLQGEQTRRLVEIYERVLADRG